MDNINIAKDVRPGCVLLTVTGAVSSYTYGEFESRVPRMERSKRITSFWISLA